MGYIKKMVHKLECMLQHMIDAQVQQVHLEQSIECHVNAARDEIIAEMRALTVPRDKICVDVRANATAPSWIIPSVPDVLATSSTGSSTLTTPDSPTDLAALQS